MVAPAFALSPLPSLNCTPAPKDVSEPPGENVALPYALKPAPGELMDTVVLPVVLLKLTLTPGAGLYEVVLPNMLACADMAEKSPNGSESNTSSRSSMPSSLRSAASSSLSSPSSSLSSSPPSPPSSSAYADGERKSAAPPTTNPEVTNSSDTQMRDMATLLEYG